MNYKEEIMEYLKEHSSPLERIQKAILQELKISQATFNFYCGILIGEGKVIVQKFATTKIYTLKEEEKNGES